MRAKEFIIERKMPQSKSAPMTSVYMFPDMPSSDPYQAYRFGMAMADHTIKHAQGPTEQKAVVVAYTAQEEEIIKGAEKQTGHRGRSVTDSQSHEVNTVNNRSAVPTYKKNRWGV